PLNTTPKSPTPQAPPSAADAPITLAPLSPPSPTQKAAPAASAAPVQAGPAENSFRALGFLALLSLAILLAMQQAASIYLPTLFTPSEIATATLYEKMLAAGQWLVPPHTDTLAAALPVYFWFIHLVDTLPYADAPYLFPLVSALSAFVALAGVYTLGLAVGFGNRVAFAAALILLSSLGFNTLAHFLSPHLFFAGLLAFSMACLYRGWVSRISYIWLALGFILAAFSTLTGGLMGLVIPLMGSLIFVVWRGSFRRAHQLDAVFGFTLLLVILAGWLGAIILLTGESTYLYTLTRQIFAPFLTPLWPPQDPWWLYFARLPMALAPWMLILLFIPWGRVCTTAWPKLKASRSALFGESSGAAWLWIALCLGGLYLTATSSKPCLAFVPLLPLAALLLAKALMNLPQANSRIFFLVLACMFALVAVGLGAFSIPLSLTFLSPYMSEFLLKALKNIHGLPIMAGVCAFAALILWKFTRRSLPGGALIVTVLLVTMLIQPAVLMVSPSLQGIVGEYQNSDTLTSPDVPTSTPPSPADLSAPMGTPAAETPPAALSPTENPVNPEIILQPKAAEPAVDAPEGAPIIPSAEPKPEIQPKIQPDAQPKPAPPAVSAPEAQPDNLRLTPPVPVQN
ncbi:MAG: hypothetical protein RRY29_08135, partial [Desulfovibrionaceae bacterium]